MAELGRLDDRGMLQLKDVLVAEEVEPTGSPAELAVEEGIIVRLPVDLSDVEVTREVKVPAQASQLLPLDRLTTRKRSMRRRA